LPSDSIRLNQFLRLFKSDSYHDFFRVLADTLEEAVLVISGDGERIITCNHAFLLLSGYARTELGDLSPAELLRDEAGEHALERILACWDSSDCTLQDVPLTTREGITTPIDLRAMPISPTRSAVMILAQPTSIRIQDKDRQQVQEKRLDTLAQISSLLLDATASSIPAILDLSKHLLGASVAGLYRVSVTTPNYVLDGSLPLEFPKSLPTSAISPLHRANKWILGQRPYHLLHKAARAAGLSALQTTPAGTSKACIGFLVIGWEDREAMLDDAESLMRVIADLCHLAILLGLQKATIAENEKLVEGLGAEINGHYAAISDTLISLDSDLKVTQANPSIYRLLGYQAEEIVGLLIQDVLVGPKDIHATLLDSLGHERISEQPRIVLHHRDGTPFPVHLRAVPISGSSRSRLLLILKDQSEQQAIEDQTEMLAQRALLGEVTAIFAHEVRNPINNISTGVQLIASRLGKEHPLYDSLEQLHKECNRLNQLMSDVLFFSRPLELKMESVNLGDFMDRILIRWGPRLSQADVHSHTSYTPDTPNVLADPRTLERVIVNLISNALEAMSDGGTLSISVDATDTTQGKMVELKVADTGPGIPPDVIERIFDPFYTTKKDGTGLGLAISRRILMAHKGKIQVESFPDAGTVFTIHLPAVTESSEAE
jgi:two-component system sensor histidine kinase AtoS